MTYHRHRGPEGSSTAVVALGALLVLIAAGVLYGTYRWVKRRGAAPVAAAPAGGAPERAGGTGLVAVETPFDNTLVDPDTDAFVMVVEVPTPPTPAEAKRIVDAVHACLSFKDEGKLFPEAEKRTRIVRVFFHHPPEAEMVARLPVDRIQIWTYGPDGRPGPLRDPDRAATPPEAEPAKTPVGIDMVLENPETGAVVLVLVEEDPWAAETARRVAERTGAYLSAVRSGALASHIDAGQAIEIHLHCRHRPDARALELLRDLRSLAGKDNIAFHAVLVGAAGEEEIDLDR